MPTLPTTLRQPGGSLVTVRCHPWTAHGDAQLGAVGDAAHAIVPLYGQGATARSRTRSRRRTDRTARRLAGRARRVRAIAGPHRRDRRLALANFVEMRDTVNRRSTGLEDGDTRAGAGAAGTYVSEYELVSFSTVPYAEVVRRVRAQRRVSRRRAVLAGLGLAAILRPIGCTVKPDLLNFVGEVRAGVPFDKVSPVRDGDGHRARSRPGAGRRGRRRGPPGPRRSLGAGTVTDRAACCGGSPTASRSASRTSSRPGPRPGKPVALASQLDVAGRWPTSVVRRHGQRRRADPS